MPELRFDERVAIITGSGRGLGRAYALLLAARGAKVVVNDLGGSLRGDGVDVAPARAVVQEIEAAGGEAVECVESVATRAGSEAIVQAALDHFGRIDILIHNAGNVRPAPLSEITHDDFDAVVDVHLRGAFNIVRRAFPFMCRVGYGRIILTSSIGGLYGNQQQVSYAVSKMGVIGLSNVAALEGAAHGVKCNVIIPAAVTRMAEGIDTSAYPPMGPELVAPAVAWLAHDSCSISGELLIAMAGRIAKAFIAETPGVYRPSWTIEQVADAIGAIRNVDAPKVFPVVPSGFAEHIGYGFQLTTSPATR